VNGTAAPVPQDWSFGHVASLTAADSLLQPIAVISHKDPAMYNPAAIVGGSVYYVRKGTRLYTKYTYVRSNHHYAPCAFVLESGSD